jgi:sorting nexin-29
MSNRSVGLEDTDYATQQEIQSAKFSTAEVNLDEAVSISQASMHSFGSSRSNSSLNREDLKQALLSVMEKKDELEQQGKSLKSLLDQEVSRGAEVRQELNDIKQINKEKLEKLEGRNNILSRENELLKHQLKKYVGAVQKLRDGPQAYETLAKLDGAKDSENAKYIDYHYEASEYEKKLIQVAEMHGELLEFNENLQRTVQGKESMISRLREELISLRGPFPDEEDRILDDNSSICSSFADSGSIGTARVLVNIWIPSVFLTGSGSSRHHVYQVRKT